MHGNKIDGRMMMNITALFVKEENPYYKSPVVKIARLYVMINLDCPGQFKVGKADIVPGEDMNENHFYNRIRGLSQSGTTLEIKHFWVGPVGIILRREKILQDNILPSKGFICKKTITGQPGHDEWFLGDYIRGINVVSNYCTTYNINQYPEDIIRLGDVSKVYYTAPGKRK